MQIKSLLTVLAVIGLAQGSVMALPVRTLAETKPTTSQTTVPCTDKLTKENIQAVLDQLAAAREKNDVEGMLKFLAPFVISSVTLDRDNTSTTFTLEGIDAHRDFLQDSVGKIKNREELGKRVNIKFINEKMAIVNSFSLKNITTKEEGKFVMSDVNVMRFAWIDGKPMITSMEIKGWLAQRPAAQP